jgi:predicted secreted Zn-dependent protease
MVSTIGLALTLAAVSMDTPTIDGIEITQSVERYLVIGTTGRGLLDEMQALGPVDPDTGRRNFGHTHAQLSWAYDFSPAGGRKCGLENVQVELDITITLPDWKPARDPGRDLELQWQAFSDALTAHELQHRAMALDAAKAVRVVLEGTPSMPCSEVNARINSATAPIMKQMSEDNSAYDARTEHGRTEGAYLIAR